MQIAPVTGCSGNWGGLAGCSGNWGGDILKAVAQLTGGGEVCSGNWGGKILKAVAQLTGRGGLAGSKHAYGRGCLSDA